MARRPLLELALATAAAVLSAELYLRAESPIPPRQLPQYRYDPVLGWSLTPGAAVPSQANEAINADGYRGPLLPRRKPAGVRRVVVLGDSLTEAFNVPWKRTYPARLAGLLSEGGERWEALSLATGSYGTVHEYLQLRETVFSYEPDLVVVQVCSNDVWDNVHGLSFQTRGPWADVGADGSLVVQPPSEKVDATLPAETSFARRAGSWLKWTSALAYRVASSRAPQASAARAESASPAAAPAAPAAPAGERSVIDPRTDPRVGHGLDVTIRLLAGMDELCRARGVALGVYLVPISLFSGFDYLAAGRTELFRLDPEVETWLFTSLLERCRSAGVRCAWSSDLLDPQKTGRKTVAHEGDPHWNGYGHELVARDIARLVPGWISRGEKR